MGVQLRGLKSVAVKTTSATSMDLTGGAMANELKCYGKLKALGDADHVIAMLGLCDDAPDRKVRSQSRG